MHFIGLKMHFFWTKLHLQVKNMPPAYAESSYTLCKPSGSPTKCILVRHFAYLVGNFVQQNTFLVRQSAI
jgi:hypothetical protein